MRQKQTIPLDLAQARIEFLKKSNESSDIFTQLTDLITLYKAHGGLTASQAPRKAFSYKNFCTKKT